LSEKSPKCVAVTAVVVKGDESRPKKCQKWVTIANNWQIGVNTIFQKNISPEDSGSTFKHNVWLLLNRLKIPRLKGKANTRGIWWKPCV
jgi:hypothetical protein